MFLLRARGFHPGPTVLDVVPFDEEDELPFGRDAEVEAA